MCTFAAARGAINRLNHCLYNLGAAGDQEEGERGVVGAGDGAVDGEPAGAGAGDFLEASAYIPGAAGDKIVYKAVRAEAPRWVCRISSDDASMRQFSEFDA